MKRILTILFTIITVSGFSQSTTITVGDISGASVANSDSLGGMPPAYFIDTTTAQNITGLKTFDNLVADTVLSSVFQSNSAVSSIRDSLVTKCECSNIAHDGTIVLPDAIVQSLIIWVDGDDEWALAAIQADGTVTLPVTVGSVVNTDTDANLCIYDSGTGATIKNRLGSSKVICYESKYKQ